MSKPRPANIDTNYPDGLESLRVVSFWDGRLGHEKQTRGVLNALSKLTVIEEAHRMVNPLSWAERIRAWLSFIALLIRPVVPRHGENRADLIIGTGSATHIPMLLFKKKCARARVVTCMTPDFPFRDRMDLCFVPQHDRQKLLDNIFKTIGPPNNVAYTDTHDHRRGLILVGGLDPKSHHWDSEALMDQVKTLVKKRPDLRWTISSSPRTPQETLHQLEDLAARIDGVEFFNSINTPPGWIEQQYQQNLTVWVTADSVSMVYEALTAGCRVGILPVRWRQKYNKFQQSLDFLAANNYVTPYDTWLTAGHFTATGVRLDEASRCAQELLRRWWPNRLQ
ncbi:MAG: mitochondrial fission ELM1 family protein [Desulfobacterales bacterium]|nr:mitochondrial fission ELM1 family protein [Desulfobacterales bacterium]